MLSQAVASGNMAGLRAVPGSRLLPRVSDRTVLKGIPRMCQIHVKSGSPPGAGHAPRWVVSEALKRNLRNPPSQSLRRDRFCGYFIFDRRLWCRIRMSLNGADRIELI
jgi:hypothetical protein